jgi:hypothetical protein
MNVAANATATTPRARTRYLFIAVKWPAPNVVDYMKVLRYPLQWRCRKTVKEVSQHGILYRM